MFRRCQACHDSQQFDNYKKKNVFLINPYLRTNIYNHHNLLFVSSTNAFANSSSSKCTFHCKPSVNRYCWFTKAKNTPLKPHNRYFGSELITHFLQKKLASFRMVSFLIRHSFGSLIPVLKSTVIERWEWKGNNLNKRDICYRFFIKTQCTTKLKDKTQTWCWFLFNNPFFL